MIPHTGTMYMHDWKAQTWNIDMTVKVEDDGRINVFAKEPPIEIMDVTETHNERAERLNGRAAMIGFVAAVISYLTTGKLFFGIY
jgi:hypothetical protein